MKRADKIANRGRCGVVYIAADSRSGSTLLDLLLSQHSSVGSVGEMEHLQRYVRDNTLYCTCGSPLEACQFWQAVERKIETMPSSKGRRLINVNTSTRKPESPRSHTLIIDLSLAIGSKILLSTLARVLPCASDYMAAGAHSLVAYEAVRRVAKLPIILDSSKDARRMKLLYMLNKGSTKILYLTRDGRAVACSRMKHKGTDMHTATHRWMSNNRKISLLSYTIKKEDILLIRYEDLCQNTRSEMIRLCDFLGITFEDQMLILNKTGRHNIGGSPMRFDQDSVEITLDDQWRHELTEADLRLFARIAGRFNRKLGYPLH